MIVISSGLLLLNQPNLTSENGLAYAQSTSIITITQPANGSTIAHEVTIQGTSQNIPGGYTLWVVVHVTIKNLNRFYPMQWPAIIQPNGNWSCLTTVGGSEDSGSLFEILAVLADQNAHARIIDYNTTSANKIPPEFSGIPLEEWSSFGTIDYSRVTVVLNSTLTKEEILPPVTASASPSTVEVEVNKSATLTVSASGGTMPYRYQWYEANTPLVGQTSVQLIITRSIVSMYTFYCRVTDSFGFNVNSNTVSMTIKPKPTPVVKIVYPDVSEVVDHEIIVHGTYQNIPAGHEIWVVVYVPVGGLNRYYPNKAPVSIDANNDWSEFTIVGGEKDGGEKFVIYAVLANTTVQQMIKEYNQKGETDNDYPGIKKEDWIMPQIYDDVSVIRTGQSNGNGDGLLIVMILVAIIGASATIIAALIKNRKKSD